MLITNSVYHVSSVRAKNSLLNVLVEGMLQGTIVKYQVKAIE